MNAKTLKTISIKDLTVGMYVERIARQSGQMKVKSRGKVTSQSIIDALKKQGIKAVVIDQSKSFEVDQQTPSEESLPDEIEAPLENEQAKPPQTAVSFDAELAVASKIHAQGKEIQQQLLDSVVTGLPMDISIPEEFSREIVDSIDRNPDALLCLTKIREKDDYLLEHSLNVAILLANFGQYIGLSEKETHELSLSGFLHDIGKIKIPDEILHKPGRLTDEEMDVMRDHVVLGIEAIEKMRIPAHMVRTVGEHHERLDGKGYPFAKSAGDISLQGRMIAIVDVYDALTADRVYKPGMPSQKALKILLQDTPHKYDKELVQRFIKCIGIYPVGSLVKLDNDTIAMVVKHNERDPLKPVVKVFYSLSGNHYLAPKDVNLIKSNVSVVSAALASEYKIDFNAFFNQKIAC